MNNGQVVG